MSASKNGGVTVGGDGEFVISVDDVPVPLAEVTVTLDDEVEKKIPNGACKTEELLCVLGVDTGYVLDVLDERGNLAPLQPGQTIQVKAGMKFFSHVPAGGSS